MDMCMGGPVGYIRYLLSVEVDTPSLEIICPRYEMDVLNNPHLEDFNFKSWDSRRWQTASGRSKVFEKINVIYEN